MVKRVYAVAECPNGGRKAIPLTTQHSFPVKNPALCKIWISRCKRDKFNIQNSSICSNHFTDDDYERDLEHELLNLPPRKKLKPTAAPTIFEFRAVPDRPSASSSRDDRMQARKRKLIADDIIGT